MVFLSIGIPIVTGFAFTRVLLSGGRRWCRHDWLRLALGIGVGFGLCSCAFFLWLLVYGKSDALYMVAEIGLAAICAGIAIRRASECCLCRTFSKHEVIYRRNSRWLLIAFATVFLFACLSFLLESRMYPAGQGDGWAIWNLRARFLFRSGAQWRMAFSNNLLWSHPDYPLLLPSMLARSWAYSGGEDVRAAVQIAMLLTFATVGVLTAGLWAIRGREKALLAGLMLLGTSSLIQLGAAQYADVPISYFMLSTLALLFLEDRLPPSVAVLAGTTAALAAWTKNEGVLFFVLLIIGRKVAKRPVSMFLIGASGVLVLLAIFKLSLAPPNYLFGQDLKTTLLRDLTDPSRYLLIVAGFMHRIGQFGGAGALNPLVPLAVVFMVMEYKPEPAGRAAQLTLAGMLAGIFATYLVTPFDLSWHIATSLDRLLLQLWPALLFTFFFLLELPPTTRRTTSTTSSTPCGQLKPPIGR